MAKYAAVSDRCRLCNDHSETWEHVYTECSIAIKLWRGIVNILPPYLKGFISNENILLPAEVPPIIVIIITIAKITLHNALFNKRDDHWFKFAKSIQFHVSAVSNFYHVSRKKMPQCWDLLLSIFSNK